MIFAITYENGEVFQHFGHTPAFKIYEAQDGKITASRLVPTGSSGHGALAGFLADLGVRALICGGIGGGARYALAEVGIAVYGGVQGDADEVAESFVAGILAFDPNARCSHHAEGHACGEHSCSH